MARKESTKTFKFASALSEHGWNVAASQPASGSNVWIEARRVLESLPERPPPVLAMMYSLFQ